MNDYFDVETDKINAPHRPIPSGLVSLQMKLYTFHCFIIRRTFPQLFN